METGIHEPLYLHPDAVEGGVGMCHVFLDSQAFVHYSHAGTRVEIGDGV